ncbi:hypothetical protein [Atlantibacter hermannii]|uniref:hypothetical protein n=1 Tax=Atlantibacter hermannii TaxID=565 RepID=UPI0013EF28FC|nr:hypothetical protein [Atlantibacter hermannii]
MEDFEERLQGLEEKVTDLNSSVLAHQTMINILLQFIELKHGEAARSGISQGLLEAMERNTLSGDSPESLITQLLTEKLRQFV